jgi:hypothetical protein
MTDASVYRGYQPGRTVESILRDRLAEDMIKAIREMLDRKANPPKARIDF